MQRTKINEVQNSNHIKFDEVYGKTKLSNVHYLKLKKPIFVQFELTNNCNQNCFFCYNVWKEEDSNTLKSNIFKKKQFAIIEKIIDNEIFSVIFSGGEPLLVDWLEELIKKVSDYKIETSLITNGVLLSKKRVEKLKYSGLSSIQISLHHYQKHINSIIVKKDTYQQTINGIKNAVEVFGPNKVNINMVVLPETYKDVYEMARFLNNLDIKHFSIGTPSATGELSKRKNHVIDKELFKNVYKQMCDVKLDFEMQATFTGGFPLCILPKIDNESIGMINNYCDAGLNQLVIDPNGNLRPCVCLNVNLGNVLQDDLNFIWNNNSFLTDIRKLKYLPKECEDCDYTHICRGGCRASAKGYFGNLCAIDPLMS
jgi:radical SAM protein with 4Fe4S-binding SPASM domain